MLKVKYDVSFTSLILWVHYHIKMNNNSPGRILPCASAMTSGADRCSQIVPYGTANFTQGNQLNRVRQEYISIAKLEEGTYLQCTQLIHLPTIFNVHMKCYHGSCQGCGVGVETRVGVGRSRPFWLESELEP